MLIYWSCYLPNAVVIRILDRHAIKFPTFIFKIQGSWFASQLEKPGKANLWNPTSDKTGSDICPWYDKMELPHIIKKYIYVSSFGGGVLNF